MTRSLYIHIPYCRRKCRYCDFASIATVDPDLTSYVELLRTEMAAAARELPPRSASTLYFGGGTPSLLPPELVQALVETARCKLLLVPDAEITLEANPGTLSPDLLNGFRAAGVNRLSLGVQSFADRELDLLGRLHTAAEARAAFTAARRAGFANISLDLMHSLPGQSLADWEHSLLQALELGPEHISAYGLTIEDGTPFAEMSRCGTLAPIDEELAVRLFETTAERLVAAGFNHYEISNFARPGFISRHNLVYWQRREYLGFGAGAHSFLRQPGFGRRWGNPADPVEYAIARAEPRPVRGETLTGREAMAEYFFLGLRMLDGVSLAQFDREFGVGALDFFPGVIERYTEAGLLSLIGDNLRLTRRGLLLANIVLAEFTATS